MSQQQNLKYALYAIIFDFVALLGALSLAQVIRNASSIGKSLGEQVEFPFPIMIVAILIWVVVYFALAVYDPQHTYRILAEFQKVVLASLFLLLIFAGTLYFSYRDVSRLMVVYFFAIYLTLLLVWRLGYRLVFHLKYKTPYPTRRVVVVGSGELAENVGMALLQQNWLGFDLVGFLSDDDYHAIADRPILGLLSQVAQITEQENIDEVIIAIPGHQHSILKKTVMDAQKLPIRVHVVPDGFNRALYRARVDDLGGLPLIHLHEFALTPYQRLMKRVFDLVVGTFLLVFSVPLMAVIAVAIKLDSQGSIIYKQERVGESGRRFTMYKFRTMLASRADDPAIHFRTDDNGTIRHKFPDDPRVTRLGYFLRRTSLDELPQLINVLHGSMSLVGPRPELPWFVEQYEPWQRERFAVPQGMTGWWQVNGRSSRPMHLHTEDDLYYIENYSMLLDIQIIVKTIGAVLRGEGAY